MDSISKALDLSINLPKFNYLLPVGISFYTFQALSYTVDTYRGHIKASKHLGKYALFVSFFPQLVAGPIERSTHLLPQFDRVNKFSPAQLRKGSLLILWGLFKKIVIADFFAIAVNNVYSSLNATNPVSYIYVTVLFAIQIYCDFSGYSNIAIGSANIMGYDIMKNFRRPYFATSIQDFWRRWHISLSTWFKDYLYIPLGGSRVSTARWCFNIMLVFVCSGLWHGANWTFVIWGALHGIYQLVGKLTYKLKARALSKVRLSKNSLIVKLPSIFITFVLVCFGWIFFRAHSVADAFTIIKSIGSFSSYSSDISSIMKDTLLPMRDIVMSLCFIVFLYIVQFVQSKISITNTLENSHWIIRWIVYIALIYSIVLLGEYGVGEASFIYFQF